MKKFISLITMIIVLVCFSTVPAQADRKTMEGVMIGLGVAIIGSSIIHSNDRNYHRSYPNHHTPPQVYYRDRRYNNHQHQGYWSVQRVWIEPSYDRRWNPAHYNQHGQWVEGRYENFETRQGYYQEERIWVRR